jgi:pSer/pThr/pTyr-binding forkhead associated (FHA) protein
MAHTIMLSVITGPHNSIRYCFRDKIRCIIGRAPDCEVELSGSARDTLISRHHCQVDIDPPHIWLTDLGSRNGTFVNGRPVAPRDDSLAPSKLQSGDIVTIGGTSLQFNVVDCPVCAHKDHHHPAPAQNSQPERQDCHEPVPACEGECHQARDVEVWPDGIAVHWKK